MAFPNLELQVKQTILHKLRVSHTLSIPRHILEQSTLDSYTDMARDELLLCLTTYLSSAKWTTSEGTKSTVKYPTTWIDAFKLRWFPQILLKHYPVNYTTITQAPAVTNNYWIFPEIPPNPNPQITEFLVAYTTRK